jgi:hypothetical protein
MINQSFCFSFCGFRYRNGSLTYLVLTIGPGTKPLYLVSNGSNGNLPSQGITLKELRTFAGRTTEVADYTHFHAVTT